jgi:polysaccharide export outer membrane protein
VGLKLCDCVPPVLAGVLRRAVIAVALAAALLAPLGAQAPATASLLPSANDYVVGSQDVLTITSYDQADLSGKFTVEADGTFTYPLIGRVRAGGMTIRQVEAQIRNQLKDGGIFNDPQLTVAIEQYKSQKVFVVGEVRMPGSYPLSGDMKLVEALARAGSTLSTASGEAIIVHSSQKHADGPVLPNQAESQDVVHVSLNVGENGMFSQSASIRDGDTIFVPRAESIYVLGQVKNPGAYPLQRADTTVLQALALAGGVTDRASTNRIRIMRAANGEKKELKVKLPDVVLPGDSIVVGERFF